MENSMITLTLDEKELQALIGLLDAGVRSTGLQSVGAAAHLFQMIEAAAKQPKLEDPQTK